MKDLSLPLLACYAFLPLQNQYILCGRAKIYIGPKLLSCAKIKIKLCIATEHDGMCWSKMEVMKILL